MLKAMLGIMGESGWVDPRSGKVQLLPNTTWLTGSGTTETGPILGPDGLMSGVRHTATLANSATYVSIPFVEWPILTTGQRYTASVFVKTPSSQGINFKFADSSWSQSTYEAGVQTIESYSNWTLVEWQGIANANTRYGLWVGVLNSFSTGEWIELALPMIYAGAKVS